MRHKISIIIYLLVFACSFTLAQNSFNGNWEGEITMERDGKTTQSFKIVIQLTQDSSGIKGKSWIWNENFKANFEIQGEIKENQMILKDVKLIEGDILPSGEWCEKIIVLLIDTNDLKKDKLEGSWQGKTTFSRCTPGKVFLKKDKDRA